MTFKERLQLNKEAYLSAKDSNECLSKEVVIRNNTKNITTAKYITSSTSNIQTGHSKNFNENNIDKD